jgi:ATP-dependent Clp endopeptidase proteolytic subunit ClpP
MTTEILLYGIIGDSWDGLDAKSILAQVQATEDDILLRINSPGGYVMEGLAVYNVLRGIRDSGRKVDVQIDALAASMASVIAMIGETITMADNALMMIHNPWDCACGDATELRRKADQLDLIRDNLVKIYSAKTGLGAEALKPMLEAETWLTADQALDQGFITTIDSASTAVGCDIQKFGFRNAPNHPAVQGIVWDRAAAAAFFQPKGTTMTGTTQTAAAKVDNAPPVIVQNPAPAATLTQKDIDAATTQARADELRRGTEIRALCTQHKIDDEFMNKLITDNVALPEARAQILDRLAQAGDDARIGGNSSIVVGLDEREKMMTGMSNALIVRAGMAPKVEQAAKLRGETVRVDPGEFRGVRPSMMARHMLERSGVRNIPLSDDEVVKIAMARNSAQGAYQTASDFPVLLENAMHKVLLASYQIQPRTWDRWCKIGSVTDFRPHPRYRYGSLSTLKQLNEAAEFDRVSIPDGMKVSIAADQKGYILTLTRKAIVNDDMGVFLDIAARMGQAAQTTIEVDAYALLAQNAGLGPTFGAAPFFDNTANKNEVTPAAAPSVASLGEMDAKFSEQKEKEGIDFIDLRPSILLAPKRVATVAKVINDAKYDPDAANKLERPNSSYGLFDQVIGTPRLTGTRYYGFADPNIAPAFECVFLNGQQEPTIETQDGWSSLGLEWRIFHEFGLGAIDPKAAQTNAGA